MTDVMRGEGIFSPSVPSGPYPVELLVWSQQAAGLRYVLLGEEGDEQILFFGHPSVPDLVAAVKTIGFTRDNRWPSEERDFAFVHARVWRHCPRHAAPEPEGDCMYCEFVSDGGWLEQPLGEVDAAQPEAFPVAVWTVNP